MTEQMEQSIDKEECYEEQQPGENFIEEILREFNLQQPDLRTYSPLTLAYIGDCVFEIMMRTRVVYTENCQVNKLHRKTSSLVKAETQSQLINLIREELTEEEEAVYKRGRNAFSATRAKNASMSDYRRATGFESLMGYLYIQKQYRRMVQLVHLGLDRIGEETCDMKN